MVYFKMTRYFFNILLQEFPGKSEFYKNAHRNFSLSRNKFYLSTNNMEVCDALETPTVNESNESLNTIREKTTEIFIPPGKKVFYNPVQEFNRDLSVLVLQTFSKEFQDKKDKTFRILEALSATGLRSIRYAKEVPSVTEVIANDYLSEAIESIKANVKHNNVESIVTPSHSDASVLMANTVYPLKKFQVVDLDPYGSPVKFLDTAVQCVEDGGMLFVTCTDLSTLCGLFPDTSYVKYGALSLKPSAKHEMALRIVLQCIQSHASRYRKYIVPILSVHADFYVRLFVKIYTSPIVCKSVISKLSMVYHCSGCDAAILQPLGIRNKKDQYLPPSLPELGGKCIHCGTDQQMGGPIWNGPIHDREFVAKMIKSDEIQQFATSKRILGVLSMIQEELDIPLFYCTASFCKLLKITPMPIITLRSALLNAGYRVSESHTSKNSVKTDAPMSFMLDVFKAWRKENVKRANIEPGSPGERVFNTPIQHKIDFSERTDANPASREMRLCRFQLNPAPFWGPGVKSRTMVPGERTPQTQNKAAKNRPKETAYDDAKKQKTEE